MIVLDTNVISEVMRPEPAARVRHWLLQLTDDRLVTTVVTIAEIEYGIARLARGKRREDLARRFAEAGVRFIEVNHGSWDQHKNHRLDLRANCQATDAPIAAATFAALHALRAAPTPLSTAAQSTSSALSKCTL